MSELMQQTGCKTCTNKHVVNDKLVTPICYPILRRDHVDDESHLKVQHVGYTALCPPNYPALKPVLAPPTYYPKCNPPSFPAIIPLHLQVYRRTRTSQQDYGWIPGRQPGAGVYDDSVFDGFQNPLEMCEIPEYQTMAMLKPLAPSSLLLQAQEICIREVPPPTAEVKKLLKHGHLKPPWMYII